MVYDSYVVGNDSYAAVNDSYAVGNDSYAAVNDSYAAVNDSYLENTSNHENYVEYLKHYHHEAHEDGGKKIYSSVSLRDLRGEYLIFILSCAPVCRGGRLS